MSAEWRTLVRDARVELGLTQDGLAEATGMSREAIRAYEAGRRRPTSVSLEAMIEALKIPNERANRIREGIGYAAVHSIRSGPLEQDRYYVRAELDRVVQLVPWPEFVVNDPIEVVAANAAAEAVWGVDFEQERANRSRAQMNLLSLAGDGDLAKRVKNWEEIAGILVSMFKANTPAPHTLDGPSPYFNEVMNEFGKGGPEFLLPLLKVWERTEPMQGKVRWSYPVVWEDPDQGEIRFLALVSLANEEESTFFNDWIPSDARSWIAFEAVKRRRDATR